ncbi:uncharacterized protein LOC143882093 [Tasmannia lanceolata]|uniref:uncharacterized protein LOC143882093 n=1 Tax=Tasmannia lanceolata TaxID=3420 RepID=UPI004063A827
MNVNPKLNLGHQEVADLFSSWIPTLSEGFCKRCKDLLQSRVENFTFGEVDKISSSNDNADGSLDFCSADSLSLASPKKSFAESTNGHHEYSVGSSNRAPDSEFSVVRGEAHTPEISKQVSAEHFSSSNNGYYENSRGSSNRGSDSYFSRRRSQFRTPVTNRLGSYEHSGSSTNGSHGNSHGSSNRSRNSENSTRWGHARTFSSATSSQVAVEHSVSLEHSISTLSLEDAVSDESSVVANGGATESGLSREQREQIRFSQVGRKKDYLFMEKINGKSVNVLEGLELHTRVFSAVEQKKIVNYVYTLQRMGQEGQLRERTFSQPRKWMRGKGRATIQFGCCYNYAVDKHGNPPGIIRDEEVDPIPPMFKTIIKRLVRWHVLPPTCVPNSCIVNIYEEGDCIPPHIDHHDFVRPFCTVSFITECNILFGANLKIVGPGEFAGPVAIPLPVGSVLILKGNGADVAKHCVPAVPAKRISITFRKMDDTKLPFKFLPDPELQGLQPLASTPNKPPTQQVRNPPVLRHNQHSGGKVEGARETLGGSFQLGQDDFPSLGS